MAATGTPTPNLGLRIPVGTDPASVDDINYNSNLLDTVLGAVGNTSVKDQLDELSDHIATIDSKMSTVSFGIERGNLLSYSYSDLNAISDSAIYKHGLLIYGTSPSDVGISFVFVNTNGAVTITNMFGTARTFTGSVNNGVLTITANAVVYGGLKLIWLT